MSRKVTANPLILRLLTGIGTMVSLRSFFRALIFGHNPMEPIRGLKQGNNTWIAVDDDPQFLISNTTSAPGWASLTFEISLSDVPKTVSSLYVDTGKGFNESECASVGVISDQRLTLYFYSALPIKQIRFDPTNLACEFSVSHFAIEPLSHTPTNELYRHLRDNHFRFQSMTDSEIRSFVEARAVRTNESFQQTLADLYNDTHRVIDTEEQSYQEWISHIEQVHNDEIVAYHKESRQTGPTISIIMPVYNPDPVLLEQAIDSVLAQSYTNWELCVTDDASPNAAIRTMLKNLSDLDTRIYVHCREENGHISVASNDALEMSSGSHIALLDHDDLLHPHALAWIAKAIQQCPRARIIYSDEDKVDEAGNRHSPHFKTDWNPDLLYSQNYISHLGVYDARTVKEVGGFRAGFEGSQDYDLLLRVLEHCRSDEIIHVPRILYHWRSIPGSTAFSANEKDYTESAGLRALNEHYTRTEHRAKAIAGPVPNTYRTIWPISKPQPLVSLIIPTRDNLHVLSECVESILERTSYQNLEILIVDNNSEESDTLAYFQKIAANSRVQVLEYHHPFNFSAINNFAARHAKGSILGFINNDIEVISDEWLDEMVMHAERADIGCVGAKLLYDNRTIQHAGVILGIGGIAGHSHKFFECDEPGYFSRLKIVQNYSAVTAAALLIRADVFNQVGGMSEELAVAFNDVDLCLKVRELGYRNLWTPHALLYHHESISRGSDTTGEKWLRFQREHEIMEQKWAAQIQHDPYYNPNLTRRTEDFALGMGT